MFPDPRRKKLPPYGDYDRDGAPNWSDCDPYDPNEQGIFKRAVGVVTGDRYGQTKEEYEQEKLEKALQKEKLKQLEAQALASGQPLQKTGPTQTAKQWLERQAERDIQIPARAKLAIERISKPVQRAHQRTSPYITGENWPEPPMAQHQPTYEEQYQPQPRRGPRYIHQKGGAYWNRKGYLSYPPSREPHINIFRDAPNIKPVNVFKKRRRY